MRGRKLKGVNLGEESLYLVLHCGIDLIYRCKLGCVLGCGGCVFILFDLEARHHLIYDGLAIVEAQFVNCSAGF